MPELTGGTLDPWREPMIGRTPDPGPRDASFSLVELVVAIFLAAILTGGLFFIVAGQRQISGRQLRHLTAQESLWGTMAYLQRQVWMAGYGIGHCPDGKVLMWNGKTGAANGTIDSPLVPLAIYNSCSLFKRGSCSPTGSGDDVDSFAVSYADEPMSGDLPSVLLKATMLPASPISILESCGNVLDHDLVVFWQPQSPTPCLLLQVTKDPRSTKHHCILLHPYAPPFNPSLEDIERLFSQPDGYAPGTRVIRMGTTAEALKFSIDSDGSHSTKIPRLVQWRKKDKSDVQVIAEGIEDMQIAWACDVNGDGLFSEGATDASRRTDEWSNNVPGDTPPRCLAPRGCAPPSCTALPMGIVRITLMARPVSSTEFSSSNEHQPAAEDHRTRMLKNKLVQRMWDTTYNKTMLTATVRPKNLMW